MLPHKAHNKQHGKTLALIDPDYKTNMIIKARHVDALVHPLDLIYKMAERSMRESLQLVSNRAYNIPGGLLG